MAHEILRLSELVASNWTHTSATQFFRIFARCTRRKIKVYFNYFGEQEKVWSLSLAETVARYHLDALRLVHPLRTVQLQLSSPATAQAIHATIQRRQSACDHASILYLPLRIQRVRLVYQRRGQWSVSGLEVGQE